MKKQIVSLLAVALGAGVIAADVSPVPTKAEQKVLAAQRLRGPRRRAHPNAGLVVKKYEGRTICVRNRQTMVPVETVRASVERVRMANYLPLVIVGADEKRDDMAVEVVLSDRLAKPGLSVLVAPEQNYAELAVDWLVADQPDAEKLAHRLDVELLRAVAMAFGCGLAVYQPDLMTFVRSARDLDRISQKTLGPEASNNVNESGLRLGVKRLDVASYYRACQQGWAPEPTNDVQRAIWKEVHEIPSKPIKIEKK